MHTDVHWPTLCIRHFTFLISRLISYVTGTTCLYATADGFIGIRHTSRRVTVPTCHSLAYTCQCHIEVFRYLKFVSTACPLLRFIHAYSYMATYFAAEMSTCTDLHPTIIGIRHLTFITLPVIWAETVTSCPSTTADESITPLVIYRHSPPPLSAVSVCDLYDRCTWFIV